MLMENDGIKRFTTSRPSPPRDVSQVRQVLGENIRRARKDAGLTQQALAEDLAKQGVQVHQTAIAKIESGTRPVTAVELVALARSLGVAGDDNIGAGTLLVDPEDARRHADRLRHVGAAAHDAFITMQLHRLEERVAEAFDGVMEDLRSYQRLIREQVTDGEHQ